MTSLPARHLSSIDLTRGGRGVGTCLRARRATAAMHLRGKA